MSATCQIVSAVVCDIGRRRRNNEDYALACEPNDPATRAENGCLYIVADGVGGGAAGEVASQFSAHFVMHHYYTQPGIASRRLQQGIAAANAILYRYAQDHPRLSTMGTTIVAAAIHAGTLSIAHVGDSRAYLLRQKAIQRLTQDHNLAAQLARDGLITQSQVANHPHRNLLLRSLGGDKTVASEIAEIPLEAGDQVLLCSDGLTRHIQDAEIEEIATACKPGEAVRTLVERANHRGGEDNITVAIACWGCSADPAATVLGILTEPPPEPDIDSILRESQSHAAGHVVQQ
jgi:protein phosphatase